MKNLAEKIEAERKKKAAIVEIVDKYTLNVKEVAELLRVHRNTVGNWIKDGTIPCLMLGAKARFNIDEIEQWVKDSVQKGTDDL